MVNPQILAYYAHRSALCFFSLTAYLGILPVFTRRAPLPASVSQSTCSGLTFWSLLTDVQVVSSLLQFKSSALVSIFMLSPGVACWVSVHVHFFTFFCEFTIEA